MILMLVGNCVQNALSSVYKMHRKNDQQVNISRALFNIILRIDRFPTSDEWFSGLIQKRHYTSLPPPETLQMFCCLESPRLGEAALSMFELDLHSGVTKSYTISFIVGFQRLCGGNISVDNVRLPWVTSRLALFRWAYPSILQCRPQRKELSTKV